MAIPLSGDGIVPMAESASLTSREAASGLLGSISLTCWIFLLVPQLIENYRNGNAEAISLLFLFVWFVGDITNLIGGAWAGLVPVIVAIAVYFCIADGVLISQCLYYKARNSRQAAARHRRRRSSVETPDTVTPLLGRRFSDAVEHHRPAARRAEGYVQGIASGPEDTLAKIVEENDVGRKAWVKNFSSVLAICVIGMAGWTMAWQTGVWKPAPKEVDGGVDMAPGAMVLGYISALCYLGARLPQIYKNYCEKSCEGLSLLFFILSLMGNLTYGAGILCHSTERNYIITNVPWLIGSLGTMIEDVTIFIQFRLYAVHDPEDTL
ncbi:vacuolar membrane PQ loop repeat protein [Aspergillus japonicus CBS 114.51]|uniref:Vacuolar membrane PQ loop repeat protein n=2 Tax=Aspergillus TaxID=5052 RepID=A0A2V5HQJ5_ASPV1|nr:vacuolar membrane PQ loop repeat protein [Aspergillus japonicus CBS 114.51]PYI14187.1 vacuolar membrane PQ loop repeat protein [Aspergillus violaceofuscus CBS 115571]RAH83330.1 vacuolar membrane PQ loop repeat protein [Aspergillus japonicus CBS 114.51]